eukprot:scaffold329782_cov902-Tisochrysis_lutea.AAC.1
MYFHGARFSNYEGWLSDPTHIKPSAQVVWPIVGQEILNGDVGGGFQGIQITSGFFQLWRASGITSELQLYSTAIGGLVLAAACFFAGWFHYHKAAPKLEWFQNVESMLNHHLAGGLNPVTGGLWLSDTAHHHLAIAVLFLVAGHQYRTNWGIGHSIKDILESHKGPFTGNGHAAHHMYAMPPYPYLATDY